MSRGSYRREMILMGVDENGAFGEQGLQSSRVAGAKPSRIVVPELIHDDCQEKFSFMWFMSWFICRNRKDRHQTGKQTCYY
jgi:hypothetical protein